MEFAFQIILGWTIHYYKYMILFCTLKLDWFSLFFYYSAAAPVTQFDEFYQINEVCAHFPSSIFNFMCRNSANELKRFDLGGFTKSKIKLWWKTLNSFCLEYNILKIDDFFRFLITHIESIKKLSHSGKKPGSMQLFNYCARINSD